MTSVRFALVHRPLVGPATWEGLAAAGQDRDHHVTVPDLTPTLSNGPPYISRQVDVVSHEVDSH